MIATRQFVRQIATSSLLQSQKAEVHKGYFELRKVQEKFQSKDGKPVFLKGGAFDQVLYRTTVALSILGLFGIGNLVYDLSYPKKE